MTFFESISQLLSLSFDLRNRLNLLLLLFHDFRDFSIIIYDVVLDVRVVLILLFGLPGFVVALKRNAATFIV